MTISTEQADALIALAAALEACHKLNINVVARDDRKVSLMIHGQHRIVTHTLDHKAIRGMTVKLTGLVYTGATVLSENGQVCKVRCACGQEFVKNRTYILQLRAKGYTLSCWRCKRKVLSEHASRQAEARAIERSKEWAV